MSTFKYIYKFDGAELRKGGQADVIKRNAVLYQKKPQLDWIIGNRETDRHRQT